uniref:Leucine-rich repeat-containing N-terminal plant-type domain-containing protein n=1 Tax=Aegilops tauschii subsp. strangulata TaxID=200361 RepID=A0A453Q3Z2_AEGTS
MAISQAARLATMLMLLPLLLISCGVGSILCSSMTTVHDNSTDMISLLDFKRAITNDSRQALTSWHTSFPLCSWEGVHCSSGRVTKLYLRQRGLFGRISSSLGNLTFLRTLDLSKNGFTGNMDFFLEEHWICPHVRPSLGEKKHSMFYLIIVLRHYNT